MVKRRHFLGTGAGLALFGFPSLSPSSSPLVLPSEHQSRVRARRCRIVMQHDVFWVLLNYLKMHPEGGVPFAPFRDAVFSYADEPGSQIDAIWWDIGGNAVGSVYPSRVFQPEVHPLVKRWHAVSVRRNTSTDIATAEASCPAKGRTGHGAGNDGWCARGAA